MTAYYNEIDPFAAEWLRNLIECGVIARGEVDERSIEDVYPSDLKGYSQCHFFAGIGGWSYSLRLAGWPDDKPIWTGSCPCQPFSAAGKGAGFADERHLWPAFFHLIQHGKRRDIPVFGEQVASSDGLGWLDLVQADLQGAGYTVRAEDICGASIGAPHIRQRLYWMAYSMHQRIDGSGDTRQIRRTEHSDGSTVSGMAYSNHEGLEGRELPGERADQCAVGSNGLVERMEFPESNGREQRRSESSGRIIASGCGQVRSGPTNGFWRDADWLRCTDDKWRPVEPGTFPLANGISNRVGLLRGYGNAIIPAVAAEFIRSCGL